MPEEGTTLSFENYDGSMRVPFIVYADFESFIKPIDTCGPNPKTATQSNIRNTLLQTSATTLSVLTMRSILTTQ